MQPVFVYIPPEDDKRGRFLNLSVMADIEEIAESNELILWGACGEEIATISGEQARHLRAALTGVSRPFPSGGLSDSEYFDRYTERREPQLPKLPDPVIVPPAVREFEEKLESRGYGSFSGGTVA